MRISSLLISNWRTALNEDTFLILKFYFLFNKGRIFNKIDNTENQEEACMLTEYWKS